MGDHNRPHDYENDNKYNESKKFIGKVQEESVKATKTISFSLKFLSIKNSTLL